MTHTIRAKSKLLDRVRRLSGQVKGIERLLEEEADGGRVLQQVAACRGALSGLMAEILEGHIRFHVVDPDIDPQSDQAQAAEQLVELVRRYFR